MVSLLPVMVMSCLTNVRWSLLKAAEKPSSHSCPMEISARFLRPGKMLPRQASRESWGNGSSAVCAACILAPSGKLTRVPFVVARLLVQGVLVPRKWIVQP